MATEYSINEGTIVYLTSVSLLLDNLEFDF